MVQATMEDVRVWQGKTVIDRNGDKVGTIDDVYFDEQTGRPEWGLINTGMFGMRHHLLPLTQSQDQAGNETIRIQWTKDQVSDAPSVEADQELSEQEERKLYDYYGLNWQQSDSQTMYAGGQQQRPMQQGTRDDAMTRSEEEVRVGTAKRPRELVRLRKYVVTENVTQTVPVSHEEVRVEREPITEANRGKAMQGPEIRESEHEVTLMEEEPVIEKRVVPKERVRLDTETVTGQQQINEQVRKEQIDVDRSEPGRSRDEDEDFNRK